MEKWVVDARFEDLDAVAYAREFLGAFDETGLARVKVRDHDNQYRSYREPGFWGYCYPPSGTMDGYRISVFACGEDYHFPLGTALWRREQKPGYRPGAFATHAGILNPEYVVRTLGEGLLWILAHEIFHYAAFTEQTALPHDERTADLVGYELLWAYREAEAPFLVGDAVRSADPQKPVGEVFRLAPSRWPYDSAGREGG